MSYQLNKTDGTVLTNLIDGQIDNFSTNLTLVGKNYTGYGEFFNENFIKLLENFSNTFSPSNPLEGQLWWDRSDKKIKVYDGTEWKSSGGPIVQNTRPQMVPGDLWLDTASRQLFAYDGSISAEQPFFLVGPSFTKLQGKSGFEVNTIVDTQGREKTVNLLNIGGTLTAIYSNETFTPAAGEPLKESLVTSTNPEGIVRKGINVIDKTDYKFWGTAERANGLVNQSGTTVFAEQFLSSITNNTSSGTLTINNAGGITLSSNGVETVSHRLLNNKYEIQSRLNDYDVSLSVVSSDPTIGSLAVDAIYVDSSELAIGIFKNNPSYTLDIAGDLRVTGNLLVEGEQTSLDISTLRVENKTIELAVSDDSTVLTDIQVDSSGIIVNSTNGSKDLLWKNTTNSWTSNTNFDLEDDNSVYKIGGRSKLYNDRLDSTITRAPGITELGVLTVLNVDNISIDGSTISAPTTDLVINSSGNIDVSGSKITQLANPTSAQDAVTKAYVDGSTILQDIVMGFDITGLRNNLLPSNQDSALHASVSTFLNDIFPAQTALPGKIARLHAVDYIGVTTTVDVDASANRSYIDVDSNGTKNESVVQDIDFDPAIGTINSSPSRYLMVYESDGVSWNFVSVSDY